MVTNYILILTIGIGLNTSFIILNIDTHEILIITRRELISYGLNPKIKLHNLKVYSDTNTFVLNSIVPRITTKLKIDNIEIKSEPINNKYSILLQLNNYEYKMYEQIEFENTEIYGEEQHKSEIQSLFNISTQETNIYYNYAKPTNTYTHIYETLQINKTNKQTNYEIIISIKEQQEIQDYTELERNSVNSIYLTHK